MGVDWQPRRLRENDQEGLEPGLLTSRRVPLPAVDWGIRKAPYPS